MKHATGQHRNGAQPTVRRAKLTRAWPQASSIALRTSAVFLAILGALICLRELASSWIDESAARWTARMTAYVLRTLGTEGRAEGATVVSSIFSIEVIGDCTAVLPIAIFLASVTAFPAPVGRKLVGLLVGLPALVLMNLVRLVSLCYIGHYAPSAFEVAHVVVWQALIVFFAVLAWLLWVNWATRVAPPAGR